MHSAALPAWRRTYWTASATAQPESITADSFGCRYAPLGTTPPAATAEAHLARTQMEFERENMQSAKRTSSFTSDRLEKHKFLIRRADTLCLLSLCTIKELND